MGLFGALIICIAIAWIALGSIFEVAEKRVAEYERQHGFRCRSAPEFSEHAEICEVIK